MNTTTRDALAFLMLTIFIFMMAGASWLVYNDVFYSILFGFCVILFINSKQPLDKFVRIFLFVWILINLFSGFANHFSTFSLLTFLGVTMKMLLPYFLVKLTGPDFFRKLLQYIYALTIISLILFALQILFPSVFSGLADTLNGITVDEQKEAGGWYIFIYMNNPWGMEETFFSMPRNSGFMWEPGGFASILIFALIFHLGYNRFKPDRKMLVYILGILSTFSTAGYIALFLLFFAMLMHRGARNIIWIILLLPLLFYVGYLGFQLEFISGKLELYQQNIGKSALHETGVTRVNRIAAMKYAIEQTWYWPLGNGVLESNYMKSTYGAIYNGSNTFANMLGLFGIPGLLFFLSMIYRFYKNYLRSNAAVALLLTMGISSILFSNSFELKPLVYCMVFYYLIFLRKKHVPAAKQPQTSFNPSPYEQ